MLDGDDFSLDATPLDGGGTVIRLHGELDLEHALAARSEIVAALEADRPLVLDLADVGFMDSSGLGALVFALREARSQGATLTVEQPQPWVHKLFQAAGVAELFGLDAHDAQAIATRPRRRATIDVDTLDEIRTLLSGYENLLRWGDLTVEQITIALRSGTVADAGDDLELAARVRGALEALGARPPAPED